jgi:hypothetical protein
MRGSIQRRGDRSWRISIEMEPDPLTGRRRLSETVHGTKRDAEARLAQLVHEHETGISVDPSRMTVAEWLRQWLAQHSPPPARDDGGTLPGCRRKSPDSCARQTAPAGPAPGPRPGALWPLARRGAGAGDGG